jgi:UDP-N-acetylglucosamine 3-dehydrogenase
MRRLGMAVIGAGRMGSFHIETLEKIEQTELVAIADPDEATARERIGRRPIDWTPGYHELLARDEIEAVCVCTPSHRHAAVALDAIAAGKHVLVEKPIATTLQDGLRIGAAAREAGVKLMVGHIERFNPAVAKLAELVADDRLGRIYRIHATRTGPLPTRILDAGVTIDLATHDLDIMQYVLGRGITSIYAEGSRFQHPSHEDMISCLLRFGDQGPMGLLDVNWLTPEKRRELVVLGEGGMLSASYLTQDVWFTESVSMPTGWDELARIRGDAEGTAVRFALRRVEPLRSELEAFADCVLNDTDEPISADDGCRALAAALAVRDSAANSRPINLLDMPGERRALHAVA